jgi:hypothetical protein
VLFLAVPFGATKAEMNSINFGHTARIYVKREKGVVKTFEVRLPATAAGKETSLGSRKTLEAALELRDAGEKNFKQMNEARDLALQRVKDAEAAETVSVPAAADCC